ncbi:hypothetical protein SDC9_195440 [bioreactor metagenome]|uniref:Uncharacterized protein n=1 Tax=bioreactor metagenome TaxID=1076179 RepID=A0A645IAA8_9ZZZZ
MKADDSVQISQNIHNILNPNRKTNGLRGDAGAYKLLIGKLAMGGGSGVYDHRARIAHIRYVH